MGMDGWMDGTAHRALWPKGAFSGGRGVLVACVAWHQFAVALRRGVGSVAHDAKY